MRWATAHHVTPSTSPITNVFCHNGLLMKTSIREYHYLILSVIHWISSCLGHVVNLANVTFMGHITKIAVVKTTAAIWEYDPTLPDNKVFNGAIDVVAVVQTLAIKVRYQSFHTLQVLIPFCRSRPPPNVSSTLKNYSMTMESRHPSRSRFTQMFGGVLHTKCWIGHQN